MTSGLDRHRNKDGEISSKHGNALVGTLRKNATAVHLPPGQETRRSSATSCINWTSFRSPSWWRSTKAFNGARE